jgi:hypothetical protein
MCTEVVAQRSRRLSTVKKQLGTSMVEFLIVIPMLLFVGLGIMQFGLVYHAKSILNYATFEAARAGAVNNGQIEVMRKELGYRLAAVYGGDGSLEKGAAAMARSGVAVNDVSVTKIQVINPAPASFEQHAVPKEVEDRHGTSRSVNAIPNTHLRFAPDAVKSDGLNIQDANLLKIEVTYGYQLRLPYLDMKVPGMPWIMRNLMIHTDQENWMYYVRGLLPIKSTATVRMQSDSWDYQQPPPAVRAFDSAYEWIYEQLEGEDGDGVNVGGQNNFVGDVNNDDEHNVNDADENTQPEPEPEPEIEVECEETDEGESGVGTDVPPEEDKGFWGSLWDDVKDGLTTGYDFVRGFWAGIKDQVSGIYDMLTNPVETVKGLIKLGKEFVNNPEETIKAISEAIGKDLSALVECGAYDRGRIIGENVNPVFMLRLATKLASFDKLEDALSATKRELGCASFLADTKVWTPNGLLPIESIRFGDDVNSRSDQNFVDKDQQVFSTFQRIAPSYRIITTEQGPIATTDEHPIWVQGRGWVEAAEIESGDILGAATGDLLVKYNRAVYKQVEVYNFSVAKSHNYFVGESGLWVHNAVCDLPRNTPIADFPGVVLREIDEAELFSGTLTGGRHSLRNIVKNHYKPNLDSAVRWQAHHVIPWELREHKLIKEIGMDMNSIHNAIPLPCSPTACATQHVGSHPVYNTAMQKFLNTIDGMDNLDLDEKKALVERGIEEAREALASKELSLNADANLSEEQWAEVLARALQ